MEGVKITKQVSVTISGDAVYALTDLCNVANVYLRNHKGSAFPAGMDPASVQAMTQLTQTIFQDT